MRVWLDDIRSMPMGYTHWAKTAQEAIDLLATGEVYYISLDHDLSEEHYRSFAPRIVSGTGYEVACWIEQAVLEGRIKCPNWRCHSMNPAGKARIEQAMSNAERF